MTEVERNLLALAKLKNELSKLGDKTERNGINLFSAVGMSRQEIKHSAFLAWLLSSENPHGLENIFIEKLFEKLYDYQTKPLYDDIKQNKEIIALSKSDFSALLKLKRGQRLQRKMINASIF